MIDFSRLRTHTTAMHIKPSMHAVNVETVLPVENNDPAPEKNIVNASTVMLLDNPDLHKLDINVDISDLRMFFIMDLQKYTVHDNILDKIDAYFLDNHATIWQTVKTHYENACTAIKSANFDKDKITRLLCNLYVFADPGDILSRYASSLKWCYDRIMTLRQAGNLAPLSELDGDDERAKARYEKLMREQVKYLSDYRCKICGRRMSDGVGLSTVRTDWDKLRLSSFEVRCSKHKSIGNDARKIPDKIKIQVMMRDDYTCRICGKKMPDGVGLQIDHIKPVAKGGTADPDNLQVLCDSCNRHKSAKYIKESEELDKFDKNYFTK